MIAPVGGSTGAWIRRARPGDVSGMVSLVAPYAREGRMLPREAADFRSALADFLVAVDRGGGVVGCGGLRRYPDGSVEIVSLAVAPSAQGTGLGRRLVERLRTTAEASGAVRTFALTLEPGFFEGRGFQVAPRRDFPGKEALDCATCPRREGCREVAVVRHAIRPGAARDPGRTALPVLTATSAGRSDLTTYTSNA